LFEEEVIFSLVYHHKFSISKSQAVTEIFSEFVINHVQYLTGHQFIIVIQTVLDSIIFIIYFSFCFKETIISSFLSKISSSQFDNVWLVKLQFKIELFIMFFISVLSIIFSEKLILFIRFLFIFVLIEIKVTEIIRLRNIAHINIDA